MSRTKRDPEIKNKCFRKPRHLSDERNLKQILTDAPIEDYPLSKTNRIRKRLTNLPDAWDDIHISALADKYCTK